MASRHELDPGRWTCLSETWGRRGCRWRRWWAAESRSIAWTLSQKGRTVLMKGDQHELEEAGDCCSCVDFMWVKLCPNQLLLWLYGSSFTGYLIERFIQLEMRNKLAWKRRHKLRTIKRISVRELPFSKRIHSWALHRLKALMPLAIANSQQRTQQSYNNRLGKWALASIVLSLR